jgi:pyridoxamine 5'-phosphate oxidase
VTTEIAAMRQEYSRHGLAEDELAADWLAQFEAWLTEMVEVGLVEPNAMVLATAAGDGRPSARTVLLKGVDERGFTFFTNYGSRKATELAVNPYCSLVFPWFPAGRQVVVCGRAERVARAESEAYFASRPREAQLGAWASPQSQVVADRAELDGLLDEMAHRFPDAAAPLPAPPHWGGLRVVPETVEFWQGRTGRMHDRLRYRRPADGSAWLVERLGP